MLPITAKDVTANTSVTERPEPSGVYNATNPAWVVFNAEMDAQLAKLDERFRHYWTMKAVRASVGR